MDTSSYVMGLMETENREDEEVESLNVESLHERIANRIPSIQGKEVSLRYLDNSNDWVELPSDDLDTFIDMVETAKQSHNRENLKVIELKVCELAQTPRSNYNSNNGSQKRPRKSPSPKYDSSNGTSGTSQESNKNCASRKPNLKTRRLEAEFSCSATSSATSTYTKPSVYETPTQKYFNKLEQGKQAIEVVVTKKHQEILDIETSLEADEFLAKRPLCSNCHTAGHNKTMCCFEPCTSATICKEIKRLPNEEKFYKAVKTELQEAKTKLKKLELDISSKKDSYAACANTFAAKVQARLIESNPDKYLRPTARNGEKVPNWLIVNTDIRKLERFCRGKVPNEMMDLQTLINDYEAGFPGVYAHEDVEAANKTSQIVPSKVLVHPQVNPVAALWKKKGVTFPGKGIVPNSANSTHIRQEIHELDIDGLDQLDRAEIEEDNADYGLSLLFRAANMIDRE